MADSVLTEYLPRWKKRRLDKASGESNSGSTHRVFRKYDPYDDEYIRQYLLYYYQFHKSEGFVIDWDKLDYWFDTIPIIEGYPISQYKTNDEAMRDVACRAISQHNEDKGTRLVFVDHVSASYMWSGGMLFWITFWAMDLASSNPEPKLYQTNVRRCGPTFCEILIFRLKPTDEDLLQLHYTSRAFRIYLLEFEPLIKPATKQRRNQKKKMKLPKKQNDEEAR